MANRYSLKSALALTRAAKTAARRADVRYSARGDVIRALDVARAALRCAESALCLATARALLGATVEVKRRRAA